MRTTQPGDSSTRTTTADTRKMQVILSRCPQNHPCPSLFVCPTGALSQRGVSAPEVDQEKCIGCGRCVSFCPGGALQLK